MLSPKGGIANPKGEDTNPSSTTREWVGQLNKDKKVKIKINLFKYYCLILIYLFNSLPAQATVSLPAKAGRIIL